MQGLVDGAYIVVEIAVLYLLGRFVVRFIRSRGGSTHTSWQSNAGKGFLRFVLGLLIAAAAFFDLAMVNGVKDAPALWLILAPALALTLALVYLLRHVPNRSVQPHCGFCAKAWSGYPRGCTSCHRAVEGTDSAEGFPATRRSWSSL